MIAVKELSVIYPDQTKAVNNLSLSIGNGESVALIGANGAGKTSFIMALMGVVSAQGTIEVEGIHLSKKTLGQIRSRVGVVFQNPDDQLFMPSIFDDIAFGLLNMGLSEEEVQNRVEQCLTKLHIQHLRKKTALKLSGGERRLVALATVLVMEPSIMILDEPSAFLDPKARRTLIHTVNALPHTKLIATHDLTFAAETCKRSILLKEGAIFADGPSNQLLFDQELMDGCGVEAIGQSIILPK